MSLVVFTTVVTMDQGWKEQCDRWYPPINSYVSWNWSSHACMELLSPSSRRVSWQPKEWQRASGCGGGKTASGGGYIGWAWLAVVGAPACWSSGGRGGSGCLHRRRWRIDSLLVSAGRSIAVVRLRLSRKTKRRNSFTKDPCNTLYYLYIRIRIADKIHDLDPFDRCWAVQIER